MTNIDANHIARTHGVETLRQTIDVGTAVPSKAAGDNDAVLAKTPTLTPAEELIAGLITDESLAPVIAALGLVEEHFEMGTGLRGAFRLAMMGSEAVEDARKHGKTGTTIDKLTYLSGLGINITEDRAEVLVRQILDDVDLADMNRRYAVVNVSGKTRVVSLEESPAVPSCKVPVFSSIPDFCAFHAKRKKVVPDKKRGAKEIGLGRWWINHSGRRQYDGIVYAPNISGNGRLNLWTGFGCEPRAGNCQLYMTHLRDNICAGNEEHAKYLLNWQAYAVQHPDRQGEVAVVMRGKEGTGKGVAAKQFGRLFGAHFRHVVHAKHLTGHFNAHLQQCSALFADEAFFAGDRAHESILKALITEEMLLIEPKGIDPFAVRNCIHLMMSSNSDWVVPAGADARRYFVLNVGDDHIQDHAYFAAIIRQMDNGGREALLYELLNRDLSDFSVQTVPQTQALAEQKQHSRRGVDRLVETIAHDGILPAAHAIHPDVAVTTGEEKGDGFYCAARALVPDLKYESSIVISNKLKEEWGCSAWKSGNQRGLRFPLLAELREKFDKRHGKQAWPKGEDEVVEWTGN